MRWGAIVRGEARGLGNLTSEVARHLRPDRTLLVDMGEHARVFPIVHDYADALRVPFNDGAFDESQIREWLAGLDLLWTAETFYDQRIVGWAREMGVRTVNLAMPEFWRSDLEPAPDVVWNPTSWRHDTLPGDARVVPVPVATDRFETPPRRQEGPIRVLHNAGHRAAMDRNGTAIVYAALRLLKPRGTVDVTISGQDGRLPSPRRGFGNVRIETRPSGAAHYWDVPTGFDILVMPRRYGGLCLPVQEALAAGCVPVMPDVSPNGDWPTVLVPARPQGTISTQGGLLPLATVDAPVLARALTDLIDDPDALAGGRSEAVEWAESHSWHTLAGLWISELERAADG